MWKLLSRMFRAVQMAHQRYDDSLEVSKCKINGRTGDVVFLADDGTPATALCRCDIATE